MVWGRKNNNEKILFFKTKDIKNKTNRFYYKCLYKRVFVYFCFNNEQTELKCVDKEGDVCLNLI